MSQQRFNQLIQICHRCKPWSQTQRPGGCWGPCPCHADGRDIIDHAKAGHCPAGFYPDGNTVDALNALPPVVIGGTLTAGDAAHGAAALVRAAMGMDKASPELVAERQAICDACEHRIMRLGLVYQCDICKCAISAKIRLKGQKCPVGKW